MSHVDETTTDVHVYRLRCAVRPGAVVFAWDYPGATPLRVRVLRAAATQSRPPDPSAPVAEPPLGSPWAIVYDGESGSFHDTGVAAGTRLRYVVFARAGDGPWTLWDDEVMLVPDADAATGCGDDRRDTTGGRP